GAVGIAGYRHRVEEEVHGHLLPLCGMGMVRVPLRGAPQMCAAPEVRLGPVEAVLLPAATTDPGHAATFMMVGLPVGLVDQQIGQPGPIPGFQLWTELVEHPSRSFQTKYADPGASPPATVLGGSEPARVGGDHIPQSSERPTSRPPARRLIGRVDRYRTRGREVLQGRLHPPRGVAGSVPALLESVRVVAGVPVLL